MTVAKYVRTFYLLLINNNIQPVLVFDGQRVPLKTDTNDKRYKYLEQDLKKPEEMYQQQNNAANNVDENDNGNDDPVATTNNTIIELKDIVVQQKLASCMREDIIYEAKVMADQEGIRVIGSPFEADSQLIALMDQAIVDFVVTDDSNIPFQGCKATVMRLSKINSLNKRKKWCCYIR